MNTISHRSVFYFFHFLYLLFLVGSYPQKSLKNWKVKNITHIFFRFFFCKQFINIFVYTRTSSLHKKKSYTPTFFHFVKIFIAIETYWIGCMIYRPNKLIGRYKNVLLEKYANIIYSPRQKCKMIYVFIIIH